MATRVAQHKLKHPYITRKKGVCAGKPIIKGARIKVSQIALEYEHLGWSPDEIIQAHPHLTLAQVHDALSYHYENAAEINAEIQAGEQLVEELRKLYPQLVLEKERRGSAHLHR